MINDSSMTVLADYPVLARLAAMRTTAWRLDARACRFIYRDGLPAVDPATVEPHKRELIALLGVSFPSATDDL